MSRLSLQIHLAESLFDSRALEALSSLLGELAPEWIEHAGFVDNRDHLHSFHGEFLDELREAADRRRNELRVQFGEASRAFWNASLTAPGSWLDLRLQFDEWIFKPVAGRYRFGNTIQVAVEIEQAVQSGWDAEQHLLRILRSLGRDLPFHHAMGCVGEEYEARNMFSDDGGLMAIGLDIARFLPGLYWLNAFGPAHVAAMGRDALLQVSAEVSEPLGQGVLLMRDEHAKSWETSPRHDQILDALGREWFFDRDDPDIDYRAPELGVPPIQRPAQGPNSMWW